MHSIWGYPWNDTEQLQLVQNMFTHMLVGDNRWDHMALICQDLHWLLIIFYIQFKVLVLIFKALYGLGPRYQKTHLLKYRLTCVHRSSEEALLLCVPPADVWLADMRGRSSGWLLHICETLYPGMPALPSSHRTLQVNLLSTFPMAVAAKGFFFRAVCKWKQWQHCNPFS